MASEWMLDSLRGFLQSPMWTLTINSFIDHKCLVFDPGEENKFSYTDIHNEYRKLVEDMLEGFSADFGISPEQFVAMCDDGLSTGTFDEKLFENIFAADDFLMFKSIMVKRNIELDLQAIELLKARAGPEEPHQSDPPSYTSVVPEQPQPQVEEEEDRILKAAIEQSKLDYQSKPSALSPQEIEKMLEAAKLESLHLYEMKQLEEEQMARHLQMALIMSEEETLKTKEGEPSGLVKGLNPPELSESRGGNLHGLVEGSSKEGMLEPTESESNTQNVKPSQVFQDTLPPEANLDVSKPSDTPPKHSGKSLWEVCAETSLSNNERDSPVEEHHQGENNRQPQEPAVTERENTWLASAKQEAQLQSSRGSTEQGELVEEVDTDPEKRAIYWRIQRDRLLALKQEQRVRYMDKAVADQRENRPMTAAMAKKVVSNPTAPHSENQQTTSQDEKEEKRQTLLKALAHRLKKEVVENLAESS